MKNVKINLWDLVEYLEGWLSDDYILTKYNLTMEDLKKLQERNFKMVQEVQ